MSFTIPDISYRPPSTSYRPAIGLIGCGGITSSHLSAYRDCGLDVVALCDLDIDRAVARRDEYYPDADVYTDHDAVLARDDIEVVDVATPPIGRPSIIADAIDAGVHVLSQKPFVLDVAVGERLVARADDANVVLAVNQNGRWSPHWRYCLEATNQGYLGDVQSVNLAVHWDHDWIAETPFDGIDHAILYDFAIHWFDFLATLLADRDPRRVAAATAHAPSQTATPPLLGQTIVAYEGCQATIALDGHTKHGSFDRTVLSGTEATVVSCGPNLNDQTVTIHCNGARCSPPIEGQWFTDGFAGSMMALLAAIAAGASPEHAASSNLRSLELCFAAIAAAEDDEPVVPGDVQRLRGQGWAD